MGSYLAIDLGAESGRMILGSLKEGALSIDEIHRFPNGMLILNGRYHWNIAHIYSEIVKGLEKCVHELRIIPTSIGIDTWGVDYSLLAEDGTLMGLPIAYRDPRTENAIDEFCQRMGRELIYSKTGNLFAPYNTLFQLYAAKKNHPKMIDAATDLLFIPDLLTYFLTGEKATEFSFATTSQLYNRTIKDWDRDIFDELRLPVDLMQKVIFSGSTVGFLNRQLSERLENSKIPVVAVATHDTASALAAMPLKNSKSAVLSSGTWSILGIKTDKAVITPYAFEKNFTNEGGIGGCNYLLKNLMGLWILQQVKSSLERNGTHYSYSQLVDLAEEARPFLSFIDIDAPAFLNPADMCKAIVDYCSETHQEIPMTAGEFARIAMESLAMKYREAIDDLKAILPVETLYITGGGIKNEMLCRFTAEACTLNVIATIPEGAAVGNILTQALASGEISSFEETQAVAEKSCTPVEYLPSGTLDWNDAYHRYKTILTIK